MPCFEVAVSVDRWGRFLPDNLPLMIGHARSDNWPIMTDQAQWVKRLKASNHKAYSHDRWKTHRPIKTDNSI